MQTDIASPPTLHYVFGDVMPAGGQAMEVAPGVLWLRMPLPISLGHINLWLLQDEWQGKRGWSIVDCGLDQPVSRELWEQIFASALDGLPVVRVIATHMHPDHLGLAHWLCARWQVPLWISATEYFCASHACKPPSDALLEQSARFIAQHGLTLTPGLRAAIHALMVDYAKFVPAVPASFHRLFDGDTLTIGGRAWRCISGYGHTVEHMALFCAELNDGVLISGDMVLPRITPNVSVLATEPEADPLRLFLQSLHRFDDLPASTLVLPSHGKPFTGLHARLAEVHVHHEEHLAALLARCREQGSSATDLLPLMFGRRLNDFETILALTETVAHLHLLWHGQQLERQQDAQGVYRFSAKA